MKKLKRNIRTIGNIKEIIEKKITLKVNEKDLENLYESDRDIKNYILILWL